MLAFLVLLIGFYAGLRGYQAFVVGNNNLLGVMDHFTGLFFSLEPFILSTQSLFVGVLTGTFFWMCWETYMSRYHKNMQQYAYGSAKWNDPKALKKMEDKDDGQNWIFTSEQKVSVNMGKTGRNRNCVIVGRPGTGKSRYWLMPNLLHCNDQTIIVTDPKGEILRSMGQSLRKRGYDIKVFNLKAKWASNHYNPFNYLKKLPKEAIFKGADLSEEDQEAILLQYEEESADIAEDDVMSLINTIMLNTRSEMIDNTSGDPFWEKAEMVFLQSLFYYTLFRLPKEQHHLETILALIRDAEPDENGISELDRKFAQWQQTDPYNIGIKQYQHFKVAAGSPKMMSTIIMTASARLAAFNIQQVSDLIVEDEMELERIGQPLDKKNPDGTRADGKVCYFICTDPNDSAFNFLAAMLYTQIFHVIDSNADKNGGSLAIPCQIFMDEFRQIGKIPNFLENLAYVRGLNVGITVILQSLSQLKKLYKDEWETALDCCDYMLFLGSQSKETLDYLSALLGKQTLYAKDDSLTYARNKSSQNSWKTYGRELATIDELSKLEKGHGILMVSGMLPFYSKLYELEKDPKYREVWNARLESSSKHDAKWAKNHELMYDHMNYLVEYQESRLVEDTKRTLQEVGINFEEVWVE